MYLEWEMVRWWDGERRANEYSGVSKWKMKHCLFVCSSSSQSEHEKYVKNGTERIHIIPVICHILMDENAMLCVLCAISNGKNSIVIAAHLCDIIDFVGKFENENIKMSTHAYAHFHTHTLIHFRKKNGYLFTLNCIVLYVQPNR